MTPATTPTGSGASATTTGSVRKHDPAAAHKPRGQGTPDAGVPTEFGAMLLAAGVLQSATLVNSIGAFGKSSVSSAAADSGSRGGGAAAKSDGAKSSDSTAARLASSQSGSSLTQSDADRLRTVGPGVNLAAIAQSELAKPMDSSARAELGQTVAPHSAGSRDASASGADTSGAEPNGRENARSGHPANTASNPTNADASATTPANPATRQPGAASPHSNTASSAIGALDRLTNAAARAHTLRPPTTAPGSISPIAIAGAGAAAGRSGTGAGATGSQTFNTPGSLPGLNASRTQNATAARPQHAETQRPHIPRDLFVQQVHRALGLAIRSADGPVTIRLTPEHLGQLKVDLSRGEAGVTARFEAATPEAQKLLESSMPDLRSALEARGLHVDRLDVRLAEQPVAHADAERRAGHDSSQGDSANTNEEPPAETGHNRGSSGGGHAQGQRTAPTHGSHDPEQDAGQDEARPIGTEADSVVTHDPGAGSEVSTFELVA